MLLSLVGGQPVPILLIDRALRPGRHILAYTDTTRTVAERLKNVLPHAEFLPLPDAYDQNAIYRILASVSTPQTVLNLTSGTKPMSWAGYEVARQYGASFVYLESERKKSVLYHSRFTDRGLRSTSRILPRLITLDDYLAVHGLEPQMSGPLTNPQEEALDHFLQAHTDACLHNLKYPAFEIDFLIQRGNQVAVIEAKSGLSKVVRKREGIDQLTTIAGREYLGTYTGRIWVVAQMPGWQLQELAQAYQIEIVCVRVIQRGGTWQIDASAQDKLLRTLDNILGMEVV